MNSMVLCPACKRHVFAKEVSCPFCGIGIEATRSALPAVPAQLSRAQRYAIGAAIAASVATASCSSPTRVHSADDVNTVDTNAGGDGSSGGGSSGGSGKVLELAVDPQDANAVAAAEEEQRRRRAEEERRRQLEEQQRQRLLEEQQNNRWRHRQCVNGHCPPYGCVFPDDACDIVRV